MGLDSALQAESDAIMVQWESGTVPGWPVSFKFMFFYCRFFTLKIRPVFKYIKFKIRQIIQISLWVFTVCYNNCFSLLHISIFKGNNEVTHGVSVFKFLVFIRIFRVRINDKYRTKCRTQLCEVTLLGGLHLFVTSNIYFLGADQFQSFHTPRFNIIVFFRKKRVRRWPTQELIQIFQHSQVGKSLHLLDQIV